MGIIETVKELLDTDVKSLLRTKEKSTEDVYIETGSYSLDGLTVRSGFPLQKTNIARKPSKSKGEIECRTCQGDGWDANSGGAVYICPRCEGTGVEDGNAVCSCGHRMYEHYLGMYSCHHDHLDLYGVHYRKDRRNPFLHKDQQRKCFCERFKSVEEELAQAQREESEDARRKHIE